MRQPAITDFINRNFPLKGATVKTPEAETGERLQRAFLVIEDLLQPGNDGSHFAWSAASAELDAAAKECRIVAEYRLMNPPPAPARLHPLFAEITAGFGVSA